MLDLVQGGAFKNGHALFSTSTSVLHGEIISLLGSGPETLHSITLLAKEPLQSYIPVSHHLKVVNSHWLKIKTQRKEYNVQVEDAQPYMQNRVCSWVLKYLLKIHMQINFFSFPSHLYYSRTQSCYYYSQNKTFHLASAHVSPSCICAHENWLSNHLKIHLCRYLQKLKKKKEAGLSHSLSM